MRPAASLAAIMLALAVGAVELAAAPSMAPVLAVWRVDKENGKAEVAGSGFLIGASGYILTARHVAEHNAYESLAVSIGSKSANRMPVLDDERCSTTYDFCVLRMLSGDVIAAKIDSADFHPVVCREIVNESILAYGFLPGNNGISSAPGITTTGVIDEGLMLTGAPFEPTMSGGPVFDKDENVVAIVIGSATHQTAILPLSVAASMLLDSGYRCNPADDDGAAADELRESERDALKELNQTVSRALSEKNVRLIPALDHYADFPTQGSWDAVMKAAEFDKASADLAIGSVVEFLSRYEPGGSADVAQLLDSALGAAPVMDERPDTGVLKETAVALAGKTGTVNEILNEPTPPSVDKAMKYRAEIAAYFEEIDVQMKSLIQTYRHWLEAA